MIHVYVPSMTNIVNYSKYKLDILKTYISLNNINNKYQLYYIYKHKEKDIFLLNDSKKKGINYKLILTFESQLEVIIYSLYLYNNHNIKLNFNSIISEPEYNLYPFYTVNSLNISKSHKDMKKKIKELEMNMMDMEIEFHKLYKIINTNILSEK